MSKDKDVPENIVKAMKTILNYCGVYKAEDEYIADLDLDKSPTRILHMWKHEMMASYKPGAYEALLDKFTTFKLRPESPKEMIVERDIPFTSCCAHHLLVFHGTASVGYIPKGKIVGLSKIPRAIDYFARQLQLQERLTSQIADFLWEHLDPQAAIVVLKAEHSCMATRGVQKAGVQTITSALRGDATENDSIKDEFYRLLRY